MSPEPLRENSIDRIPGVGKKRSEVLSRLGIHTIGHFLNMTATDDGVTQISQELKISERTVLQIRHEAVRLAGKESRSGSNRLSLGYAIAWMAMCAGILSIVGGAVILGMSFQEGRLTTFSVVLLENDVTEQSTWWVVRGESTFQESGVTSTKIVVKPGWRGGFSTDFPESILEGLFLHSLPRHTVMKSACAMLSFIEVGTRAVEGPWVEQVDLSKRDVNIQTTVEDVPDLHYYVGTNLIVHLDLNGLPKDLQRRQEVDFRLELQLEDTGFSSPLNRYIEGFVCVLANLKASEARFLGYAKETHGGLEMPGRRIKLEKNPEPVEVEYMWEPELQGEFVEPDDMIGASRFWRYDRGGVDGSFVFKARGCSWFSYVAAILGVQLFMVGFTVARKRHSRARWFHKNNGLGR